MANAKKLTNIIIKVLKGRGLSSSHALIKALALIMACVGLKPLFFNTLIIMFVNFFALAIKHPDLKKRSYH